MRPLPHLLVAIDAPRFPCSFRDRLEDLTFALLTSPTLSRAPGSNSCAESQPVQLPLKSSSPYPPVRNVLRHSHCDTPCVYSYRLTAAVSGFDGLALPELAAAGKGSALADQCLQPGDRISPYELSERPASHRTIHHNIKPSNVLVDEGGANR